MDRLFFQEKKNWKCISDEGKNIYKGREARNNIVVWGNSKQFVARVRVNNKDLPIIYGMGLLEKRHSINVYVNKWNGTSLH